MKTCWRLVQFARPLRRYSPQYLFFSVAGIVGLKLFVVSGALGGGISK